MIIFYAVAGNNCLFSRNSISKGYFYRIFLKIGSPENRYNVRFPTKNKFKLLQWMLINANVFSLFFFFFLISMLSVLRYTVWSLVRELRSHKLGSVAKKNLYLKGVLLLSHIQGYCYHLSKFHIYALVYCTGVFLSGLLHSV